MYLLYYRYLYVIGIRGIAPLIYCLEGCKLDLLFPYDRVSIGAVLDIGRNYYSYRISIGPG